MAAALAWGPLAATVADVKVFDLICPHGHVFEGWFASEADYADQQQRGLLVCPVCDAGDIRKRPSAPRLNLGHGAAPTEPAPAAQPPADAPLSPSAIKAIVHEVVQQVLARTEDVGERFADEARRIHHGRAPERGIRGQASAAEREALADEGIEVMALPVWRPARH